MRTGRTGKMRGMRRGRGAGSLQVGLTKKRLALVFQGCWRNGLGPASATDWRCFQLLQWA